MKATLSVCKCILAFCRQLQTKAESQHQSPTSSDSNGLAVISIVSATLISTLPSDFLLFRCTTRLFRFYKEQSKELCRFFFLSLLHEKPKLINSLCPISKPATSKDVLQLTAGQRLRFYLLRILTTVLQFVSSEEVTCCTFKTLIVLA